MKNTISITFPVVLDNTNIHILHNMIRIKMKYKRECGHLCCRHLSMLKDVI